MKNDAVIAKDAEEVRCECSKLLARQMPEGYELKCGRCKALWLLPREFGAKPLELNASRRGRT